MILTVLEARVDAARADALTAAFRALVSRGTPPGLVSTQLLRSTADATLWRLETLWRDREALDAMRKQGTPAGVVLFRDAGAEATLTIFDVVAS